MINEFELYHGAALTMLIDSAPMGIKIRRFDKSGNASYVINDQIGLFLKHSTKRMTPWRFTFAKAHQDEIELLMKAYGQVFVGFVCGKDGVAVLSYQELKVILDEIFEEYEWISLSRNTRQEYTVKGTDGKLGKKIARNEYPTKVLDALFKKEH